ncbi:hypothetical protein L0P73_21225 [[Clostridium] innocuum]|nr:hypothetical protein [[Clostridium] innocuum]MCR0332902.1 hypothetical protein [[Clostridium] innocuum]
MFDTATAEEVIRRVLELPVDIFDIQSAKGTTQDLSECLCHWEH